MDRRTTESMDSDRAMNDRSDNSPKSKATEDARLRQHAIGAKLRQMFDEVVNEPVPDDFLDILRKADAESQDKS